MSVLVPSVPPIFGDQLSAEDATRYFQELQARGDTQITADELVIPEHLDPDKLRDARLAASKHMMDFLMEGLR